MLNLRKTSIGLLIIILFLLTVSINFSLCHATSPINYVNQFTHSVEVNEYGFVFINDTLTFYNNYTTQVSIPEIKLSYPSQYNNRLFLYYVSDLSFQVSSSMEDNLTYLKLSPTKEVTVNPGSTYNLTLSSYVERILYSNQSQILYVNLALYPGVSLSSSKIISKVSIPMSTTFPLLEGYNMTSTIDRTIYSRTYNNILVGARRFQNLSLGVLSESGMVLIEVPKADRTIQILDEGSVWVIDTVQIRNIGKQNITSLRLAMLNPNLLSIKVVKPVGPEEDVDLDMNKKYNLKTEIHYNETYTFTIKYPAPSSLIKLVDGKYSGNITAYPPINGVVKEYIIKLDFSNGIKPLQQDSPKKFINAHQYTKERLVIEYEPKLFWASSIIIPTSLFVLIILLGAMSYFQKGEGEEKKYYADFFNVVQDKLQIVNSTVELYEERRVGRTVKQRFNILKQEYLSRMNQMNSTLAKTTSDVIKGSPEKNVQLEKISRLNRNLDQALRIITVDYDQLQAGRIGKEEFEKRKPESVKKLDAIRKEIEEELRTF